MIRTREPGQAVDWGLGLLAGAGAGVAASMGSVLTRALMQALLPPLIPSIGSAFVAGLLGGVLYAGLSRVSRHPARVFWIVVLLLATADSILIAAVPGAAGPAPRPLAPFAGLVYPIRQIATLVGHGHFGPRRFPAQYLVAATVIHFVTAGAVALLVPMWAKRRPA